MIETALTPVAMNWTEASIPITLFVVIGFVLAAWIKSAQQKRLVQTRGEVQQRMLDRFSSSGEFVAFLQTEEGAKYLESVTETPLASPVEKLMGSVRTGVVIIFISLGLIAAGAVEGEIFDTLSIGVLGLFVGVGFLVSGYLTHRMARSFGLLEPKGARQTADAG